MKVHSVKIVKSHAIAGTMVLAIHNREFAHAVLVGPANIVRRNVHSEPLDSIVHNNVTAISTIRSHVTQLMDDAFVKHHGPVSIQLNTLAQLFKFASNYLTYILFQPNKI